MASRYERFVTELRNRDEANLLRTIVPVSASGSIVVSRNGKRLVNFASNDYLNLAADESLKQRAMDATKQWGTGARGSRLLTGTSPLHESVERHLAELLEREATLLFGTGFQANCTVIPSLATRTSALFIDRQCHSSIVQGARLSGATIHRYRHGDLNHLEQQLAASADEEGTTRWIITETLFSALGTCTDINRLVKIAQQHKAYLMVDDAHAFGVLGKKGMGLTTGYPEIDVVVGTFGKAAGCAGAYVALSSLLRDVLVNFCAGFIYSTALPPPVVGAIEGALELIPNLDAKRAEILKLAQRLRKETQSLGFDTSHSTAHIVPLVTKSAEQATALAEHLEDHGILGMAMRPPSTAPDQAIVRFGITAGHTHEHVDQLVTALRKWNGN